MPRPRLTPTEWDALFDRYLASGQTQRAFCKANDVTFDAFRSRYQKSAKFAGKRRSSPSPRATAPGRGGFVPVRARGSGGCAGGAPIAAAVSIRLGADVTIECPAGIGAATIAEIAREAAR